jgi:hypothetical protein
MSLRKSPELTPELRAARRSNARRSTGPRTPAGKQNSKFNGARHGAYAASENHYHIMRALGEDPQEFEMLKQQLMVSYGPADALWQHQVEDLAKLYWRRQRLERAQEGMMRRALLAAQEHQRRRREEMAGATFDASQPLEILAAPLSESTDLGVRLRRILSSLGVIRRWVAQTSAVEVCGSSSDPDTNRGAQIRGSALPGSETNQQSAVRNAQSPITNQQSPIADAQSTIERLYRGMMGWRQVQLLKLLRQASEPGPSAPPGDPPRQELLKLLDQEIARVREEFEYGEKVNEERAILERDACLVPVGDEWRTLVRLEDALDRSIDRKVKILLALRKQYSDDPELAAAPDDQPGEAEGTLSPREETLTESINKMLGIDLPSPAAAT